MYEVIPTGEVRAYLDSLDRAESKSVMTAIKALKLIGPNLRRPYYDYLRDGIFELRARRHRILYCRQGDRFTLLTVFFKKGADVPREEIDAALKMRRQIGAV